ncbi:MAG: dihydrofolate synthase / folylpolyglutamate synthase [Pyrinomonadaceae bacterium]|jgi:dihydrofolate synthase/folylpolyglutamate synthase|nr:dihydrofolate synthase / folylpolyglutamate synthase [Pyrinomonadaceae bacterium]
MEFSETLSYLLSLGHETLAMKLGLKNTELLLEALGNPHHSFPSVQIAGTNGKGSTAAMLDSICRQAGVRAGLFTSPHLISITERIKIAGVDISAPTFAKLATQVKAASESLVVQGKLQTLPTFFEHVTAIALLAFKEAGVDLAILETGLGGRLDSTTVAGARVVAITPIALDHQDYLGATLAEIAAEKAAIIRPGTTAIIAAQNEEVSEVIRRRAGECKVDPSIADYRASIDAVTADGRFTVTFQTKRNRYESVRLGLLGRHQIENAATAIRLAEAINLQGWKIPQTAIVDGLATAQHGGRLELIDGYLLDGAHNPSAAQSLLSYLNEFVDVPVTLVFGAMRDKNLVEMAAILFPAAARVVLTQANNPRSASAEELEEIARAMGVPNFFVTHSISEALTRANEVTSLPGLVCITGSLYLLGEAKALINARQP